MKKLKMPRRISGEIALAIFMVLSFMIPVHAADEEVDKRCSDLPNVELKERYNVSFVSGNSSTNQYTLRMEPTSSDKDLQKKLRNVKLRVVEINNRKINDNSMILEYKKDLIIPGEFVYPSALGLEGYPNEEMMRVVLQSLEPDVDGKCTGYVGFFADITKIGKPHFVKEDIGTIEEADFGNLQSSIDCNNIKDNFEKEFCYAKSQAQKAPVYQNSSSKLINFTDKFNNNMNFSKLVGDKTTSKFQCDYKTLHKEEDLVGENYYVNKGYLYGSGTYDVDVGTYKYHYVPNDDPKTENVKCKVKCEEAVTVEYGPPVASKAGLCFEYKIKVTSRVSCSMTEKPKKPQVPSEVCTPNPYCVSDAKYGASKYAGPNEEFDSCIKNCDGGKYTDSCNQKCYNQVYGKKGVKKANNVLNVNYAQKMVNEGDFSAASCIANSKYKGCYVRSKTTGEIVWESSANTEGRWYTINNYKANVIDNWGGRNYVRNGFWIHVFAGTFEYHGHTYKRGEECRDNCTWDDSQCGSNQYLNPGMAEKDKQQNEELYNKAVATCKAAASCNSSTATFTISVDYSHNTKDGVKDVTIDFPYSKQEDKLASLGVGNSGANTSDANNTTLLGYNGCYKDKNNERWYQAEWSFPGTWINNKTGEITYVNKNNDKGWQSMKNKFCIPLDAKDVNQKWWAYYYNTMLKGKKTSTDSDAYKDNCGNNSDSITNRTTPAAPDKWNIRGKTFKFGYYDWNLEAECFYALNSNPANVPKSDKKATEKCSTDVPEDKVTVPNYKVRPVDLTNMFPAVDGSKTTGSNGNGTTTGRAPGYNWTEYANNSKNPAFSSAPSRYISKVQELGYTVYSDNSLDYEFVLTTDILRKMRDKTKNKDKNYTKYEGKSEVSELGVVNYKSSELRTGDLSSATKKLPTEKGRLCNNMVNYSSSLCDSN